MATVQPVAAASDLAGDHFIRDVPVGWGEANSGGFYSLSGPASDFWVSTAEYRRGLGYMLVPRPGASRAAHLSGVRAANLEIGFTVATTASEGDGPHYAYAVARRSGGREVRAKVIFNRNCTISMNASVLDGGRERPIGPTAIVPTANWCGWNSTGRSVTLRAQISGNRVRIKAWSPVGGTPSAWQWSATSTSLPASGAVGLRVYASSSAANGATFTFFNWYARAL